MDDRKLADICRQMRKDCLTMADAAGKSGFHFGGTLSLIEIMAVLYTETIEIGKPPFQGQERDRVILSKGHGVAALYAVLHQIGILDEAELKTFKADNTELYGHPSINQRLGIEFSSGSLGQGLSQGVGTALALKMHGNYQSRIFVILGDGECDEGAVWEAAMSAAKYNLDRLVVIVDKNHIQYDGATEEIMPLASLEQKWQSFGWQTQVIDGHNLVECRQALAGKCDKPLAVIADTIKGKGISFMEGELSWHHAVMTKAQREQAWEEVCND